MMPARPRRSTARPGRIALLTAALLGAWLALGSAGALALEGEALEARVREVTAELRCPTCQAISVKDSEAPFSRQITGKVRRMLQEGQSPEQIKAYFVSRYGEWILRAPKKEGLGLVLWVLPGVAIVAVGAFLVARMARSARQAQAPETAAAAPGPEGASASTLSEADRERVERDLRRFEQEG